MKPNPSNQQKIITVEKMRESDAYTIANFTDSKTLMHRAAMGIYNSIDWKDKKIAIITGSGNNGGDGYALSLILAQNGIMPHIFRISDKFSEDGKYYYNLAMQKSVSDYIFDESINLTGYDVIVDCILGTGFKGEPSGKVAGAIRAINSSGAYVVSADINSGLDGNTGEAVLAVKSDLTVSIGYLKTGMFKADALQLIGELINVDIGIVLV